MGTSCFRMCSGSAFRALGTTLAVICAFALLGWIYVEQHYVSRCTEAERRSSNLGNQNHGNATLQPPINVIVQLPKENKTEMKAAAIEKKWDFDWDRYWRKYPVTSKCSWLGTYNCYMYTTVYVIALNGNRKSC